MAKYITPAITPLHSDGTLDVSGAKALYEHLIAGGVDGILILGSIGEFFALDMERKKQLITLAAESIRGRVQLIVGTADNEISRVIELSRFALAQGADAVMMVPPFYFWLNEQSIWDFYSTVAQAVEGKVYLYNFPDRTGYQIPVQTVLHLAQKHQNIVGLKDTISGMDHTREVIKAVKPVRADFEIFSGFDDNFAHNVLSGGDGCIGGLSNLAPEVCSAWVKAANDSDFAALSAIQQTIDRLMSIYAVGMPFVPYIKRALQLRGVKVAGGVTPPLPVPTPEDDEKLLAILRAEKLI